MLLIDTAVNKIKEKENSTIITKKKNLFLELLLFEIKFAWTRELKRQYIKLNIFVWK